MNISAARLVGAVIMVLGFVLLLSSVSTISVEHHGIVKAKYIESNILGDRYHVVLIEDSALIDLQVSATTYFTTVVGAAYNSTMPTTTYHLAALISGLVIALLGFLMVLGKKLPITIG